MSSPPEALKFFSEFSPSLAPTHAPTLHHLSTLLLPIHVQNDEVAQRFRNEKYQIRMSRSGFSLLVGWLTEGVGGEATGSGDGFAGERGKRGRAAVMRVVNNHLKFDGKAYFVHLVLIHMYLLEIQSRRQQPLQHLRMLGKRLRVSWRRCCHNLGSRMPSRSMRLKET